MEFKWKQKNLKDSNLNSSFKIISKLLAELLPGNKTVLIHQEKAATWIYFKHESRKPLESAYLGIVWSIKFRYRLQFKNHCSLRQSSPARVYDSLPFMQRIPGQHMALRWHLLRNPRHAAQNGFSCWGLRQNFLVLQSLSDKHCEPCEEKELSQG